MLNAVGGDPEDLIELLEDFINNSPNLVEDIRSAGEAENWHEMRVAAHSLKGNARDFGATRLSALCLDLELQCREGTVSDAKSIVSEIEKEEQTVRLELTSIKENDAGDL